MGTSTTETLSREDVARLDRLIVACNDGTRAQAAAARIVGGSRARRLEESALRRAAFAQELAEVVRAFGGDAEAHGSTDSTSAYETLRAAIHGVNRLIIGENAGDAYGSCARIEAKTEKLYERASLRHMPTVVTEVVKRQQLEIAAGRVELRRLSMGGALA